VDVPPVPPVPPPPPAPPPPPKSPAPPPKSPNSGSGQSFQDLIAKGVKLKKVPSNEKNNSSAATGNVKGATTQTSKASVSPKPSGAQQSNSPSAAALQAQVAAMKQGRAYRKLRKLPQFQQI
jgi:hypothetical protein